MIEVSVPATYRTDLLTGQAAGIIANYIAQAHGLDGEWQLEQDGQAIPADTVLSTDTGTFALTPRPTA